MDIREASWAFALAMYSRPGVAEACLRLQSEAGVDIMILLLCAFAAARHGQILTQSDLAAVDALVAPWREQIVKPLRALRTTLKSGMPPMNNFRTEALRSDIKISEQAAERLQSDMLSHWLQNNVRASATITHSDLHDVLYSMIATGLIDQRRHDVEALLPEIDLIARAAF